MLILHVVAPAEVGGLESVVRTLGAALRRAGHRVHVAAIVGQDGRDHPFCLAAAEAGLEVHPLRLPARAYLRERRELRALYRRLGPDVIHTHGYRADVIGTAAARGLPLAVVTTVHGTTGGGWKNRLYEELQRRAFPRMDAVVAVSGHLHERIGGHARRRARLHLIRNAWSDGDGMLPAGAAREALQVPDSAFHVGWVGRLSPEKGPDVLLDAVPRLDGDRLTVSFVGAGPEADRLKRRAEKAGVGARVRWHGTVPDARRLFRAFDAFVLSSRTEGTPIALLEAMAAGVPIAATGVGGVPEMLSEDEALLVPPENPPALAEALRAIRGDSAAAHRRACAAAERLEREFGVEGWIDRYESVYHHAIRLAADRDGRVRARPVPAGQG